MSTRIKNELKVVKRKVRKIGNSSGITLSKRFLESIGVKNNDFVYIDEEKLKDAMVKVHVDREANSDIDMLINKSIQQYDPLYKELVDK